MSRNALVPTAVAVLAALALAACTTAVGGTPEASRPATTAPSESAANNADKVVAGVGECVNGNDPAPVDCARPHTVEITKAGQFKEAVPAGVSWRDAIFQAVFPTCRAEAANYLGSEHYDVTTLGAWMLWPDDAGRRNGERWYRCGVAALGGDGSAEPRTGSAKGILTGQGLDQYRFCSATRPSNHLPQRISCDKPHPAEAISTVPMGTATDRYPGEPAFQRAANPACKKAMTEYLGNARNDVVASWRWPDEVTWRQGFNNIVCYVEANRNYTGTLSGLGSRPLPR